MRIPQGVDAAEALEGGQQPDEGGQSGERALECWCGETQGRHLC